MRAGSRVYARPRSDSSLRPRTAELFDWLHALGLIELHEDAEALRAAVSAERSDGAAITTATNDEARELNALNREDRVRAGVVDDGRTVEGVEAEHRRG